MTEEIIPKPVRTWAIFKNTNNTLEGIESIAFAMWQVALDEIEKESDNVVFMSDDTVKLIMGTLKRLEQENEQMKSTLEEINLILDELKQQYDYMTDYSEIKEIQDKITEVLQDD